MVGRTRYTLPLPGWLARKFDALERQLDYRVLASARAGQPARPTSASACSSRAGSSCSTASSSTSACPSTCAGRSGSSDPRRSSPRARTPAAAALVGRALDARAEAAGRGRGARRLADGDAPVRLAVAHACSRRSPTPSAGSRSAAATPSARLSSYTEGLVEDVRGIPVTASFEAYMDLSAFTAKPPLPLPEPPTALFVGMLEAYKNIDGLVAAWRRVVRELPDARLVIVGKGTRQDLVDELVAELPGQRRAHRASCSPDVVAAQMDACDRARAARRAPRGSARVVIEAFARGRGVVASRVGGIPDVGARRRGGAPRRDRGRRRACGGARAASLSDRALAERLGAAALERYRDVAHDAGRVRGPRPRARRRDAARRRRGPGRAAARPHRRRRDLPAATRRGGPTRPSTPSARRSTTASSRRPSAAPGPPGRRRPGLDPARAPLARLPRLALLLRLAAVSRAPARAALPTWGRDRRVALHRLLRPPRHRRCAAAIARRSSSRRTATGERRPASAARGFACSSRRSPTGPRATRSATRTLCARSRRSRPSSPSARRACRRSSRSRPTSISAPSPAGRRRRCRERRPRSSSGCSSARRASTTLAERVAARRGARAGGSARRSSAAERSPTSSTACATTIPDRVEHVEAAAAARASPSAWTSATCLVAPVAHRGSRPRDPRELRPRPRGDRDAASAASRISSRTTSTDCSSRAATSTALADALVAAPDRRRARRAARAAALRGVAAASSGRPTTTRRACARSSTGRSSEARALMRLIFVTQSVDADDPILGATVAKLRALAAALRRAVVIRDHIGAHDLPAELHARDLRRRRRQARPRLRYMRALVPSCSRRERPDAVIAHMCPIYLVLAAPLAKLVRRAARALVHALDDRPDARSSRRALADVALSVDRRSYPIDRPKVLGIGHGIDVAQFAARDGGAARRTARCGCSRSAARRRRRASRRSCGRARSAAREGLELHARDPRAVDDGRGAAPPRASSRR